jgi:cytochrome c2
MIFQTARSRLAALAALALLTGVLAASARADDAEDGREPYLQVCSKCHGLIAEDTISWAPENLRAPAVTMPLGPPLTGIYLRPAGTVDGYAYSRAFRATAENPWTWDEVALDGWLTNTQEFIRGSTMFVKVEQPDRGRIIAYLKKYATYKAEH